MAAKICRIIVKDVNIVNSSNCITYLSKIPVMDTSRIEDS